MLWTVGDVRDQLPERQNSRSHYFLVPAPSPDRLPHVTRGERQHKLLVVPNGIDDACTPRFTVVRRCRTDGHVRCVVARAQVPIPVR